MHVLVDRNTVRERRKRAWNEVEGAGADMARSDALLVMRIAPLSAYLIGSENSRAAIWEDYEINSVK